MSTCAYLNMHICIYVHIYLKASFYSLSPERDDLVANVMTAAVTEGNAPARGRASGRGRVSGIANLGRGGADGGVSG